MEPADRSAAIGQIAPEQLVSDLKDTFEYLKNLPQTIADKIGVTGYCFGGGMTWRAAVSVPDLDAAVPYYGPNPPLDQVPNTRAAVLAFYGEQDARINAGINDIEAAMKAANKTFEYKIMPGALHGFFNDTRPQTYQEAAAKDAWTMTLAWFQKYLKG